jgi:hypothetical protein
MIKRRDFITGAIGAGMAASGAAVLGNTGISAKTVNNVKELKELVIPGDDYFLVTLLGYYCAGDGGGKIMFWDPYCQLQENGGTVIASWKRKVGLWRQLHQGELDFRQFGVFNADRPADSALEAMVTDPDVYLVRASTALNFTQRHSFSRSGITLDFGNHQVTANGIEAAGSVLPSLSAIMLFTGSITDNPLIAPLNECVPEQSDIFPVGNNHGFTIGDWYRLESGILTGKSERIIQRLVQITEYIDDTRVRVNYKTGYALSVGDSLCWTPVSPVQDVTITNLRFIGNGDTPEHEAHPLAFQYAVNCNVKGVQAVGTFWPVIFRYWNTGYRTEQCSLINPPTMTYGGAGYLTQQIYCLYGHISDCTVSNARHLNDFTASAYCRVDNCHASGDSEGGFNTHGQYEHDLVFKGNSGIMAVANSGQQWGLSARRIQVEQHICTMLLADAFVSDLTLTDVYVLRSCYPDRPAILRVNTDGLQMRGCRVNGEMTLIRNGNISYRPALIEGCNVQMDNFQDEDISKLVAASYGGEPAPTILRNTLNGTGRLTFVQCRFDGNSQDTKWRLYGQEVIFSSCQFTNVSLQVAGTQPQRMVFTSDCTLTGTGLVEPLLTRQGDQPVTWKISDLSSWVTNPDGIHMRIASGVNQFLLRGSEFSGGRRIFTDNAFANASRLIEENNSFLANCRTQYPKSNLRVRIHNPLDGEA